MPSSNGRMKVATVLGTRPEIIKCSTLIPSFDSLFSHTLIHTGQHYDDNMDAAFFRDLGLRAPDHTLNVGSGSQATQLAGMLVGIEAILDSVQPDWVVVQGDTNSTLAGGLAAAKRQIKVAHIEAGCRSFNRAMPEELNRIMVDHLSELCLAPDQIAVDNLRAEGIRERRIVHAGSTGIDACLRASTLPDRSDLIRRLGVRPGEFLVATIHRAENTTPERLSGLLGALGDLSADWPVVFPVHPRTAKVMQGLDYPTSVTCIEPVGYPQMMRLLRESRALLTDSGGLQEEAAVLGTPTFILRDETEWMAFVEAGHHQLAGTERQAIVELVRTILTGGAQEQRMREPLGRERAGATGKILQALLAGTGTAAVSSS